MIDRIKTAIEILKKNRPTIAEQDQIRLLLQEILELETAKQNAALNAARTHDAANRRY